MMLSILELFIPNWYAYPANVVANFKKSLLTLIILLHLSNNREKQYEFGIVSIVALPLSSKAIMLPEIETLPENSKCEYWLYVCENPFILSPFKYNFVPGIRLNGLL